MLERERTQLDRDRVLAQASGRRDEVGGGSRARGQAALGRGQERQGVHGERARAAGDAQDRRRSARRRSPSSSRRSRRRKQVDRAARGRLPGAQGARRRRGEGGAARRSPSSTAQIAEERKLREVAAARVRPDVLKKYSTIRMRRGLAMVPVKNGTCQGCNMNIPPQLFNSCSAATRSSCAATATASSTGTSCWRIRTATPAEPKEKPQPVVLFVRWEFVGEGEVVAGGASRERKVRAPQGRVPANGRSGRPEGKCHRKQTAVARGKGEMVR